MALRCLLFTSDEGTAKTICQVLAGLGVEGEPCSEAVLAVEKVTNQPYQIVIIDWDQQPEAGLLLTTARDRKATERPLTLAIVSDDASVPKALQAGANSMLRKPIVISQITDTLTTARDLLRAKHESAATGAQAAAAGGSAGAMAALPASLEQEKPLRAGEFLPTAPLAPAGQIVTEAEANKSQEPEETDPVTPLKDLEPVAASTEEEHDVSEAAPKHPDTKGLQWYLKGRAKQMSGPAAYMPASASTGASAGAGNPELLGYDELPSPAPVAPPPAPTSTPPTTLESAMRAIRAEEPTRIERAHEKKTEEQLFAYIAGRREKPEGAPRPAFRLGKGAIIGASVLAACAIVAAPQAPWHSGLRGFWTHQRQAMHVWLNPQPATPPPVPTSHENLGLRAGDEYKLPQAENIPDATTDPSQIQVVPAVDPTIRKPNYEGGNALPGTTQAGPFGSPGDQSPAPAVQVLENPAPQTTGNAQLAGQPVNTAPTPVSAAATAGQPIIHSYTPPTVLPAPPAVMPPPLLKNAQPRAPAIPGNVPSSLKSQVASLTPESSGNKPPETALPSIEPVVLPEATARGLLTDQPAIAYPANARGQSGTVTLQVLIGRDGAVQDAKFLQGSLAFARTAIDGVKQWKFKPYMMNGRPVSVQTAVTMAFRPES